MRRVQREIKALKALIQSYLGGQVPFWSFHHSFIDGFVRLPDAVSKTSGWEKWQKAYELVSLAAPDPVTPENRSIGIIGEDQLKRELNSLPWSALPE
jgi:hypothetical protein